MSAYDDLLVAKRQLAWDMVQHSQLAHPEVQEFFGLSPASEDVLLREHADSHERFGEVRHLTGNIEALSAIASVIACRGILKAHDDSADDSDVEEWTALFGAMLAVSTTAILANLVDRGLLTPATLEGHRHG